jgi:signal peptidase I
VLVDRTAYLWTTPARGDVIVFRCPDRAGELCIKRIVGLPGETLVLGAEGWQADGEVLVGLPHAQLRHEDWAAFRARTGSPDRAPVRWSLGPEEYFVVGDNWAASDDSRNWWRGPGLSAKLFVGKALGVR